MVGAEKNAFIAKIMQACELDQRWRIRLHACRLIADLSSSASALIQAFCTVGEVCALVLEEQDDATEDSNVVESKILLTHGAFRTLIFLGKCCAKSGRRVEEYCKEVGILSRIKGAIDTIAISGSAAMRHQALLAAVWIASENVAVDGTENLGLDCLWMERLFSQATFFPD